jgi:hypothetical protein
MSHLYSDTELSRLRDPHTTLTYKQEWLKRLSTTRKRASKRQQSQLRRMRHSFRNYFGLS